MPMYQGFECQEFERDGDKLVEVTLEPTNHVVLTAEDFDLVLVNSTTPDEFTAAVAAAKKKKLQQWLDKRGEDSELGRNREAGTPQATTEHGSDGS